MEENDPFSSLSSHDLIGNPLGIPKSFPIKGGKRQTYCLEPRFLAMVHLPLLGRLETIEPLGHPQGIVKIPWPRT